MRIWTRTLGGLRARPWPGPRSYDRCDAEATLLTWGEAIAKMTGFPATGFSLQARGFIAPGIAADVVIFDPAEIHDNASYLTPHRRPTGISHVLVNGVAAGSAGAGMVLAGPSGRTE